MVIFSLKINRRLVIFFVVACFIFSGCGAGGGGGAGPGPGPGPGDGKSDNTSGFAAVVTLVAIVFGTYIVKLITKDSKGDSLSFPWPPPRSSCFYEIPPKYFLSRNHSPVTLSQVARIISIALNHNGYSDKSYYFAPEGFSLVTRLEKFHPSGEFVQGIERWKIEVKHNKEWSLTGYIKALLKGKTEGHFRFFAFIVTTSPLIQSSEKLKSSDVKKMVLGGAGQITEEIGKKLMSSNHKIFALVYEFSLREKQEFLSLTSPGLITGKMHLEKSNILNTIKRISL